MGFFWQEFWSGSPFPPSGDLLDYWIELKSLMSPAFAGGLFTTNATWEAIYLTNDISISLISLRPIKANIIVDPLAKYFKDLVNIAIILFLSNFSRFSFLLSVYFFFKTNSTIKEIITKANKPRTPPTIGPV